MHFFQLQSPIRWLFLAHALAGALALLVFAIPLLSKKGGKVHVRVGWVYTFAMLFVGFSAFIITPWRGFLDPARTTHSQSFALFLFFISAFALASINYGLRALKLKKRREPTRAVSEIGPPIAVIVLGLFVQLVGYRLGSTLLMAFPFLGHLTMKRQLEYWLKPPVLKMHWWYAHMNGMFTACIATVTAFLVTAVPRLWPGTFSESPILWIAPGIVMGTILNRWEAGFTKQFEGSPSPARR